MFCLNFSGFVIFFSMASFRFSIFLCAFWYLLLCFLVSFFALVGIFFQLKNKKILFSIFRVYIFFSLIKRTSSSEVIASPAHHGNLSPLNLTYIPFHRSLLCFPVLLLICEDNHQLESTKLLRVNKSVCTNAMFQDIPTLDGTPCILLHPLSNSRTMLHSLYVKISIPHTTPRLVATHDCQGLCQFSQTNIHFISFGARESVEKFRLTTIVG